MHKPRDELTGLTFSQDIRFGNHLRINLLFNSLEETFSKLNFVIKSRLSEYRGDLLNVYERIKIKNNDINYPRLLVALHLGGISSLNSTPYNRHWKSSRESGLIKMF